MAIVDQTGNNDGTYNGALYQQPGEIGLALGFDGNNDYVGIPASADFNFGTLDFTIFCLLKNNVAANTVPIITHSNDLQNYAVDFNDSSGVAFVLGGVLALAARITDTEWHQIAATRAGTVLTAYNNAIAGTPNTIPAGTPVSFSGDIAIGGDPYQSQGYGACRIEKFIIWKGVALSQAELATYNDWSYVL